MIPSLPMDVPPLPFEVPPLPFEIPPLPNTIPPLPPYFRFFDTETYLITKSKLAPPLVCLSMASRVSSTEISTSLCLRDDGIELLRRDFAQPGTVFVSHNLPFDFGVASNKAPDLLFHIFKAYRQGRAHCTIVRQKLLDIARGMRKFRHLKVDDKIVVTKSKYDLADLIKWYYGEYVEKDDTWRKSYAFLDNVPLHLWPPSAAEYAKKDAALHMRVFEAQERQILELFGELPNQCEQQRASFALHLMSMWGVRADAAAVERFIANCEEEIEKMHKDLAGTGIFKPEWKCRARKCKYVDDVRWESCPKCGMIGLCSPNPEFGVRSMQEIRRRVVVSCTKLQIPVPMTDPSPKFPEGQVATDKETLELTDDVPLHVLATQMTFQKNLDQWGPVCQAAVHRPVCARYEVLVETGRTACSGSKDQEGTNFQNPPRKGILRPCFIPRQGFLFCFTDADTVELRAHAQNCLELVGWSKMAEALWDQHQNKGPDLHLRLAANILGIDPYEALRLKNEGDVEVLLARQFAKIPNFGFPGGLGPPTMVTYAAGQLDKEMHGKWFGTDPGEQLRRATNLREIWFGTWPENKKYFKKVGKMLGDEKEGTVHQLMSGRIRGGTRFTAAANGFFQGRVADAMKEILFDLAEECYTARCTREHVHGGSSLCTLQGRSILGGSRPMLFLHDEPGLEHPEDGTESDRAEAQRQIVVTGLSHWLKDIPVTSSAVLCRRWEKGAEPLFVKNEKGTNQLVPVKPEKIVDIATGKTKVRWVEDKKAA